MKYSEGLKKNADFQAVYKNGVQAANRYLVLYVKENNLGINRVGISVSKKIGNSIVRHRVKRLVKEAYRLQEEYFQKGYDLVFIGRGRSKESTYFDIEGAVCQLALKMGVMRQEQ